MPTGVRQDVPNNDMERAVVIVAYEGVQPLDITGPHEVFAGANEALAHLSPDAPRYRLHVVSVDGGLVVAESGLRMGADPLSSAPSGPIDVLLLPGGAGVKAACRVDQRLVGYVVDAAPRARRLVTVCSGTFLAAVGRVARRAARHHALGAGQGVAIRGPLGSTSTPTRSTCV